MAAKKDDGRKTIAENRKARFEYRIEDTWEAGIELTGTEVKSLRTGQANIAESYASAESGGIFLINSYIPEYKAAGNFFQHNPRRPRRLLLHKSEIHKLSIAVDRQGMTMVPLVALSWCSASTSRLASSTSRWLPHDGSSQTSLPAYVAGTE